MKIFFKITPNLVKSQTIQLTFGIKNSSDFASRRRFNPFTNCLLKFPRSSEIKRVLPQLSGIVACHQNVSYVLEEPSKRINSPRSFYLLSPKYATLTHELLPLMKTHGSKAPVSEELTSEDKTLNTNRFVYPTQSASEENLFKSIKELNYLPKAIVQDAYNLNREFFKEGINHIRMLNDEILKECFRFFAKVENIEHEIRTFEQKCCDNIESWPADNVLLVSDAFHLINYHAPLFNKKMYVYMEKRVHLLSRYNIVQLAYLVGENRNAPSPLMSKLQKRMLTFKNEFTVSEIGAICTGFFKSQTHITATKLLTSFAKRLVLEDLCAVDSHSLVGICKMFRYAYFGSELLFNKMAHEIVERIPTMHIEALTHIALTYSTLRMFDAPLMNAIAQVYVRKIKHGRCKDVTKCLWSMSTLAHVPPNVDQFHNTALYEIRRRLVEYSKHPNHLTSALLALAYMDVYPLDVIDYVFSTTFLDSVKSYRRTKKMDLRPDLYLLNSSLLIDRPLYCGNTLPKDVLLEGNLPADFHANFDQELNKSKFLKPVISCISEILGDSHLIKPSFILPHMNTLDIELRLAESGKPIPVSRWGSRDERTKTTSSASAVVQQIMEQGNTSLRLDQGLQLKSKPVAGPTRIAIVLWSRNHYRFGAKEHVESRCLLGLHAMKRRHLLLLGYKIIELPFYELEHVVGEGNSLHQYLTKKLLEHPQLRDLN